MAFICIKNDEKIYSFIYSLKDWIVLKEDKIVDTYVGPHPKSTYEQLIKKYLC